MKQHVILKPERIAGSQHFELSSWFKPAEFCLKRAWDWHFLFFVVIKPELINILAGKGLAITHFLSIVDEPSLKSYFNFIPSHFTYLCSDWPNYCEDTVYGYQLMSIFTNASGVSLLCVSFYGVPTLHTQRNSLWNGTIFLRKKNKKENAETTKRRKRRRPCVCEDEEEEGGRKEGGIMLILSSIYHSREQRPAVQPTLRCDK